MLVLLILPLLFPDHYLSSAGIMAILGCSPPNVSYQPLCLENRISLSSTPLPALVEGLLQKDEPF